MATALTSSVVGLREAAEDKRLFGLELSTKQAELLDIIEGTGTTVIACGRQSGKTLCAAVAATHNALLRPDLDSRSRSDMHSLPRMLRIAFMIATKRQIGDHATESVPRGLRKQAERNGAKDPNGAINVLSLRPRAERHLYEASQHAGFGKPQAGGGGT